MMLKALTITLIVAGVTVFVVAFVAQSQRLTHAQQRIAILMSNIDHMRALARCHVPENDTLALRLSYSLQEMTNESAQGNR